MATGSVPVGLSEECDGRDLGDPETWDGCATGNLFGINSNERASQNVREWREGGSTGPLILSGCLLSKLPPELSQLEDLRELVLSYNNLREFPPKFFELPLAKLTMFRTLDNSTHEVPRELWNMTTLTSLTISGCFLSTVSSSLSTLTRLTKLDVSCTTLSSLPAEIGGCVVLEKLRVNNCLELTTLPREIRGCVSLKKLCCYGSGLKSLPIELGLLPELEHLGCTAVNLDDEKMQALVDPDPDLNFTDSPKLRAHLRTRALAELTGCLTKRAVDEGAAASETDK